MLCVLTGADALAEKLGSFTAHLMPEDFGAPKGTAFQPVLNAEKVRFVGDRVAFVVAETLTQARDAAELVEVDYEPLPAVVDLEDAAKDGAVKVWEDCPQGNIGFRLMFGNKDATDAAFAKAKHVVKLRVENNRSRPSPWSRGSRSATTTRPKTTTRSTDQPEPAWRAHGDVARLPRAGEPGPGRVAPDVGGGFGLKAVFPTTRSCWAARRCAAR